MPKLVDSVKEVFNKNGIYAVATASASGLPNVVPIHFAKIYEEEEDTILLADNFMDKSYKNIEENPWIAISVWDTGKKLAYQIKGQASIVKSGKAFDDALAWVQKVKPDLKPKSAVLLKVTNVYNCQPGPDLGKEL
ncbi:MAG: pyridoxamine 5'-phosphate oxidase family protein [Clostridiales bacterium]|nr:pyridoxamine 5'-phosphate oxidase family protein [Clostridiales bacterium]MCF8021782.1 pyridoxamine 5'-phosphate oxidase family protein [Clostridiales bacterium]